MVATGYRELIVLRHAKTESEASSDRARQLTDRGRDDARAAGRWLRDNGFEPAVALTSPAARAVTTTDLVVAELAGTPDVRVVEDLYQAEVDDVVPVLAAVEDEVDTVLLVGHNPTMAELVETLRADAAGSGVDLPTAGLAVLRLRGSWEQLAAGSAELAATHVARG